MKVLIVPLDWGLGHATRMLSVIRMLENHNHSVHIAAGGKGYLFLKSELKTAVTRLPSLQIRYPAGKMVTLHLLFQLPRILCRLYQIRQAFLQIADRIQPHLIISDNHPAIWHRSIPSIYVTHQVNPQLLPNWKGLNTYAAFIHYLVIRRFSSLWIPDLPPPNRVAGKLSECKRVSLPCHYIGLLSRFTTNPQDVLHEIPEILILLSGPEPQRTIFERIVLEQLQNDQRKILVVRGFQQNPPSIKAVNMQCYPHLPTHHLNKLLQATPLIISRAGYSTIADLLHLKRKALLVPTPGQPEQEYLAARMHRKGFFLIRNQNALDLREALPALSAFCPMHQEVQQPGLLLQAIKAIMKKGEKEG